jgi:hypothetical protein
LPSWALDHLLTSAALADPVVAPFDWLEGWPSVLPGGGSRLGVAVCSGDAQQSHGRVVVAIQQLEQLSGDHPLEFSWVNSSMQRCGHVQCAIALNQEAQFAVMRW